MLTVASCIVRSDPVFVGWGEADGAGFVQLAEEFDTGGADEAGVEAVLGLAAGLG
jgi:hypothetical protein